MSNSKSYRLFYDIDKKKLSTIIEVKLDKIKFWIIVIIWLPIQVHVIIYLDLLNIINKNIKNLIINKKNKIIYK